MKRGKQSAETIRKRFLWQKGYKHSDTTKNKISLSNSIKDLDNELIKKDYLKGMTLIEIGKKFNVHFSTISNRLKKLKVLTRTIHQSKEWRKRISDASKGKKHPKLSGENHYLWIKDRTKLCRISKQGERRTSAYFYWRKQVWLRDNFKCKIANPNCKGRIEAHHILGWTDYPELRYEISNGITLCHHHHPKYKKAREMASYLKSLISEDRHFAEFMKFSQGFTPKT